MRKHWIFVIALTSLLTGQNEVSGINLCDCLCGWQGHAEALYWKPLHCSIPWAENIETLPSGQLAVTPFGYDGAYDWGFRVGADYYSNCYCFGVSYRWFRSTSTRLQQNLGEFPDSGLLLLGTEESVAFGTGRFFWRYQTAISELGFPLLHTCKSELKLLAQARWTRIDIHYELHGPNQQTPFPETVSNFGGKFSGGGIGLALDAYRQLICNFSFYGKMGMNALIGEYRRRHIVSVGLTNNPDLIGHPYSATMIVPQLEMDVGLCWCWCLRCARLGARIGYALDYFLDGIHFPVENTLIDGLASSPPEDVGFAGLYFGLKANF